MQRFGIKKWLNAFRVMDQPAGLPAAFPVVALSIFEYIPPPPGGQIITTETNVNLTTELGVELITEETPI